MHHHSRPSSASLRDGYLRCTSHDKATQQEVPITDLSYVLLEHSHITLSHALLVALTKAKVALITCDEKHLPTGLLLPMAGHYLHTERVRWQCALTPPQKALLWKQIIRAKIKNQAHLLKQAGKRGSTYLQQVCRETDADNATPKEAQAARAYWTSLFGPTFRRARCGGPPNAALNYSYALLRAAMARALATQGCHLSIALHHHNRYNPLALVDDMMEPYRPCADHIVYTQHTQSPYGKTLTQDQRHHLLTRLQPSPTPQAPMAFHEAIALTASTYIEVLKKRRKRITFPPIIAPAS